MDHDRLLDSLGRLGKFFGMVADGSEEDLSGQVFPSSYFKKIQGAIREAGNENPWFTLANVRFALKAWSLALHEKNLIQWTGLYRGMLPVRSPRIIGLVMAGNVPMVGFHDYLATLVSGHNLVAKLSRDDSALIESVHEILSDMDPRVGDRVKFTHATLDGFDAVIATGSNNTSRYFDYYFGQYPNIIRRNRNGVAVLTGDERKEELKGLVQDVFMYFGLGCRSVSKIYLPAGFDPGSLFGHFEAGSDVAMHSKYMNNYDYQKAVLLVNKIPFHDNGFIILRENTAVSSPVATLHFEFYKGPEELELRLESESENIQCIVSGLSMPGKVVPLGQAQLPSLWDYADGRDTMEFLASV